MTGNAYETSSLSENADGTLNEISHLIDAHDGTRKYIHANVSLELTMHKKEDIMLWLRFSCIFGLRAIIS
jgi:hypothetical protein